MTESITNPDVFTRPSPIYGTPITFYKYSKHSWDLYIASHAKPNSKNFSWGGFRILRGQDRETVDPVIDAVGLADGMEQKKAWINTTDIGTPIWKKYQEQIFGGKVVLQPTSDAEIGQPRDLELLEFAASCFLDFEKRSGIVLITGQDLGHGKTTQGMGSLEYTRKFYDGIGEVNTSIPTAEGNYYFLDGMFKGLGRTLKGANIGLFGCGAIGKHLLSRLLEAGADIEVLEPNVTTRQNLERQLQRKIYSPNEKQAFFALSHLEAIADNALRATFDDETVQTIANNRNLIFVTGCENNSMVAKNGPEIFRNAGKLYCPYALCGMNGGHAAVGNRLLQYERQLGTSNCQFNIDDYIQAARPLSAIAQKATKLFLSQQDSVQFDEAVREVCKHNQTL